MRAIDARRETTIGLAEKLEPTFQIIKEVASKHQKYGVILRDTFSIEECLYLKSLGYKLMLVDDKIEISWAP